MAAFQIWLSSLLFLIGLQASSSFSIFLEGLVFCQFLPHSLKKIGSKIPFKVPTSGLLRFSEESSSFQITNLGGAIYRSAPDLAQGEIDGSFFDFYVLKNLVVHPPSCFE